MSSGTIAGRDHAVIPSALDRRIAHVGVLAQIWCERAILVAHWPLDVG